MKERYMMRKFAYTIWMAIVMRSLAKRPLHQKFNEPSNKHDCFTKENKRTNRIKL